MKWGHARFDEVLRRVERKINLDDISEYDCVGVRWYGLGAFVRKRLAGASIARKQQWLIKRGDVVYNKLFAWKGSFAIANDSVDGCIVSDKFPTYEIDVDRLDPRWLALYFKLPEVADQAARLSKGAAAISKLTLNPPQFWDLTIPLPPLEVQRRIVTRAEAVTSRIDEAVQLRRGVEHDAHQILVDAYRSLVARAPVRPMSEVAPLLRRPVRIDSDDDYFELGVRSFGRGTFHKPSVNGADLGTKRIFEIHPGDLIFNIVFAWEGAVAVAGENDRGRVGSHRFLTCVPRADDTTAEFLRFHFLTTEGLRQLGQASPGGAGRNRTLGLQSLGNVLVPVPPLKKQRSFDELQERTSHLLESGDKSRAEGDALVRSALRRAFSGEF